MWWTRTLVNCLTVLTRSRHFFGVSSAFPAKNKQQVEVTYLKKVIGILKKNQSKDQIIMNTFNLIFKSSTENIRVWPTTQYNSFKCFENNSKIKYQPSAEPTVQVNLFQKPSFLHHLTHNLTRYCSLNSPESTS